MPTPVPTTSQPTARVLAGPFLQVEKWRFLEELVKGMEKEGVLKQGRGATSSRHTPLLHGESS